MANVTYTVLLNNGTTGTISSDSINGSASDFIGEIVNIHFYDENGNETEEQGVLAEVLEEN